MADAARKFEIQISTPADLSGAQKAAASLNGLKVSVDGLSQSTRSQLGLLTDSEKAQQKLNEKVDESNLSTKEQHRLMADLNRLLPGVAGGLHAAFAEEPIAKVALGAAAVVEVLAKISEHLFEIEKRGREAFASLRESALEAQDGVEQLGQKNEEFWRSMERHAEEAKSKDAFSVAMADLQSKLDAAQRVLEAQKQTDLQSVDASVKAGQLPKEQADARKNEIEAFYRELLSGKQKESSQAEIDQRAKRIEELEKELATVNEELHAVQRINASQGTADRDANISEVKKFISELADKFSNPTFNNQAPEVVVPPFLRQIDKHLGETIPANEPNFENFSKWAQQIVQILEKDKAAHDEGQRVLEEKSNSISGELQGLNTQQTIARNKASDVNSAAAQITALNNLADAIKQLSSLGVLGHTVATPIPFRPGQQTFSNQSAEDIFNRGVAGLTARQHLQRGQKLSEENQRNIDLLNQLIESLGWGPQVVANVERMILLHQSTANIVKTMDTRIHQLEEDIKAVSRPRT